MAKPRAMSVGVKEIFVSRLWAKVVKLIMPPPAGSTASLTSVRCWKAKSRAVRVTRRMQVSRGYFFLAGMGEKIGNLWGDASGLCAVCLRPFSDHTQWYSKSAQAVPAKRLQKSDRDKWGQIDLGGIARY